MSNTKIDSNDLPPTQYLILEVLASRYRTGEQLWTFPSRLGAQIDALAQRGLVWSKSGVAPKSIQVFLTDAGLEAALMAGFESPIERIEARVRAEVAEEIARKIEAVCARFHHGQTCECWEYSKIARSLAAGSSPDTTPEPREVKLITHWLPFSLAAENHPFTDEQRAALAGHEDHQTAGAWSAFGWRELHCTTCQKSLWAVAAPREDS